MLFMVKTVHFSAGVDVILALGKTHLDYDDLLRHESIAQTIEVST